MRGEQERMDVQSEQAGTGIFSRNHPGRQTGGQFEGTQRVPAGKEERFAYELPPESIPRNHSSLLRSQGIMLGIRPPEYFPRLEYLALVQHVDHFILADTFPYRGESFQDRSKIRDAQGWHWITIPLFGNPEGVPFVDVEIETGGRWQEKHWRSFLYNYRTTMYFSHLKERLRPFFEATWDRLGACTSRSVELLVDLYGISTSLTRASELTGAPADIPTILEATDACLLARTNDSIEDSTSLTTDLQVVSYEAPTYRQNFEGFEPGMTAADLLFNYGPEARRLLAEGLNPSIKRKP